QLDDVPTAVEEVEGRGSAIGVDDCRAVFLLGIVVELEDLLVAAEPRSRLLDRARRDIDREVVASVRAVVRLLEANRRTAEADPEYRVGLPDGHAEPSAPEGRLRRRIRGGQRQLRNPHAFGIPSR